MTFAIAFFRRSLSALMGLVAVSTLSGCLFVTDTSRMNPDVFVQETAPIFHFDSPNAFQRPPEPPAPGQISRQPAELFKTRFQQLHGMPIGNPHHRSMYDAVRDDDRTIPAVPYSRVDPRYLRQEVEYRTAEVPGTIVVDTKERFLYLVQPDNRAIRYGVGIGRDGYSWSGRGTIQWKAKWPRWTPPDEMVERQPQLAQVSAARGGMNPGLNNPLGARALYIFQDGKDTLYRVHGTPDWQSVGKATSSGCVRLFNQDVIDLYNRVGEKAPIVVL